MLKKDCEDHEVVWGNYTQDSFTEALLLEPGRYIFLPLSTQTDMNIMIYCQSPSDLRIRADTVKNSKTFALLL